MSSLLRQKKKKKPHGVQNDKALQVLDHDPICLNTFAHFELVFADPREAQRLIHPLRLEVPLPHTKPHDPVRHQSRHILYLALQSAPDAEPVMVRIDI